MNKSVPFLSPGDTLRIVAPAKAIEPEKVDHAKEVLEGLGFVVEIGEHCKDHYNYFSGTIEDRLSDFQQALDDPNVKAVLCARGGYGCVHLVDRVNWLHFQQAPKWIIGFSDVTILHHRVQKLGIPSVHGTMPLDFSKHTSEALETFVDALTKPDYSIQCDHHDHNVSGEAKGVLVGGNLSILYSLLGTDDQIDYTDKILFIEDLAEHLYVIDRIFHSLRKASVLTKIKGLIVGGMTDMADTETPYGKSLEEIILSHFNGAEIPIAFGFPAGHIADNRALRLGSAVDLSVKKEGVKLSFHSS